jgi:hypothetical protein
MARQAGDFHKAAKDEILATYGCCAACGMASVSFLEFDHVQPRAFYTERNIPVDTSVRNGQILCHACNKLKGNIYHVPKLSPRAPEYDTREQDKNRAIWAGIVQECENSQKLW